MENRKFVYAFRNCHGATSIVNYDAANSNVNTFLSLFDIWRSNGEFKLSADGNHQEVWFELPHGMLTMLDTLSFESAFERMGVKLVFDYPWTAK